MIPHYKAGLIAASRPLYVDHKTSKEDPRRFCMHQKDKDMKLHGFMWKHFQGNGGITKDIDFGGGAKNTLDHF